MLNGAELRVATIASVVFVFACTEVQNKSSAASSGGDDERDAASEPDTAGSGGAGRAGSGASEAGSNAAGSDSGGGRGGAGGTSDSDGAAGQSTSEAGAPSAGQGGSGSQAGTGVPAAGSGGEAGSTAAPSSGTVRGSLIDTLRRPIANVELQIGDKTTTTDGLGKFEVEGVAATYDVGFKLTTLVAQVPTSYAWRFEGLTRRDPTLQVYPSAEGQIASLLWHTRGTTFPPAENHILLAGFGSPDGDFAAEVNTPDYDSPIVYWSGRNSTLGTTHMLHYVTAADQDLPTDYLAYDNTPVTLTVGEDAEATFELANTKPPVGQIAGRVNALGTGDRENWLVLRWTDGTSLVVGDDASGSDNFSYFVPTIVNASAAVVAFRGRPTTYPLAVGFADNLVAGQSDIQIEVPIASTLVAPGDATSGVGADTMFQWSGDAKVFVFVARAGRDQGYDAMYVVTSAKQTRLPVVPGVPYTPPAGASFSWHVETHNRVASVDEATGDAGLISAFWDGRLHGPRRGAGSYTASAQRTFTTRNTQ